MIRLCWLFPEHLNLNGDGGNIQVLSFRMREYGINCSVDEVAAGSEIPEADFYLLGHGSRAAWANLARNKYFESRISGIVSSGKLLLAVASGADFIYRLSNIKQTAVGSELNPEALRPEGVALGAPSDLGAGTRVSKFTTVQLGAQSVSGYVNTTSTHPVIARESNLLLTYLHGPVLAKNPELADSLISELSSQRLEKTDALERLDAFALSAVQVGQAQR